jgi:hypothetical protein
VRIHERSNRRPARVSQQRIFTRMLVRLGIPSDVPLDGSGIGIGHSVLVSCPRDRLTGDGISATLALAIQSPQPIHRNHIPRRRAGNERLAGPVVEREFQLSWHSVGVWARTARSVAGGFFPGRKRCRNFTIYTYSHSTSLRRAGCSAACNATSGLSIKATRTRRLDFILNRYQPIATTLST